MTQNMIERVTEAIEADLNLGFKLPQSTARAAIEAMRNPPHEIRIIAMMQGWNAAIDAALEGGE